MFKIGQEVVFVGGCKLHSAAITPRKYTQVVTIKYIVADGWYVLNGFQFDLDGDQQEFEQAELRSLSDILAEISIAELTEELVEL